MKEKDLKDLEDLNSINVGSTVSAADNALLAALFGSEHEAAEIDLPPGLLPRYVTSDVTAAEREVVEAALELWPALHGEIAELRETARIAAAPAPEVRLLAHFFGEEAWADEPAAMLDLADEAASVPDLPPGLLPRYVTSDVTAAEREVVEAALELWPALHGEIAELRETARIAVEPLTDMEGEQRALPLWARIRQAFTLPSLALAATSAVVATLLTPFVHSRPQPHTDAPTTPNHIAKTPPVMLPDDLTWKYFSTHGMVVKGLETSTPRIPQTQIVVKTDPNLIKRNRELVAKGAEITRKNSALRADNARLLLEIKHNGKKSAIAHRQMDAVVRADAASVLDLGTGEAPHARRTIGGNDDREVQLISPVNTNVITTRPVLRWNRITQGEKNALSQIEDYNVTWFVFRDKQFVPDTVKTEAVHGDSYALPPLKRGETYGWQVKTAPPGSNSGDDRMPHSKMALFTVMTAQTYRQQRSLILELTKAYLKAGLLDNARQQIEQLDADDPDAGKLEQRLQELAQ